MSIAYIHAQQHNGILENEISTSMTNGVVTTENDDVTRTVTHEKNFIYWMLIIKSIMSM